MGKIATLLALVLIMNQVYAHGNHGGNGNVSNEDDLASGAHLHLPVRVEPSGAIVFGYENPFADTHQEEEHEDGHEEDYHDHDHDADGESEHKHGFHIAPTIVIGGDYLSRLISKDTSKEEGKFETQKTEGTNGFIHIKNSKLLLGSGLELHQHLNVAPFGAGIGLMYAKNQSSYSEIHIKDKSEMTRELKLPGNFKDFSEWRTNEKLSYVTNGSIIFSLGAGIDPIVHGGLVASASGTWSVKLQKITENKLSVSVSSVKAVSLGVEVEGALAVISAETMKAYEKGLNFSLNMNSPKAIDALKQLYKGDLREVQKLTADSSLTERVVNNNSEMKGRGSSMNFNVPFLFGAGISKYRLQSYQLSQGLGVDAKVYSSIVNKEESTKGILSNHKKELDQFSTTYVNELHGDHRDLYYASNYKWHYEKDEVSALTLKNKLERLAIQTGFKQLSSLYLNENNLGYFRISFDISFTEYDMLEIINYFKSAPNNLTNSLILQIAKTVNAENAFLFCGQNTNTETSVNLVEECIQQMKSKTSLQLAKLKQLGRSSNKYIKEKNYAEATKTFSQLGALLVKNQFLLQEALNKTFDTKINLTIEGEKVKRQIFSIQ